MNSRRISTTLALGIAAIDLAIQELCDPPRMSSQSPPGSRYTYLNLGICMIVGNGLNQEVTGITVQQTVELLEMASDEERDEVFAVWAKEARQRSENSR